MALSLRLDVSVPSIFGRAQLLTLTRQLQDYENRWARDLQKKARTYPERRPGQTYRRTYRFRRDWHITPSRFVGQNLEVSVLNNTPYNVNVVGDDLGRGQNQQWHAGRWYLIRDLAQQGDFARGAQSIIERNIRNAAFRSSVNP